MSTNAVCNIDIVFILLEMAASLRAVLMLLVFFIDIDSMFCGDVWFEMYGSWYEGDTATVKCIVTHEFQEPVMSVTSTIGTGESDPAAFSYQYSVSGYIPEYSSNDEDIYNLKSVTCTNSSGTVTLTAAFILTAYLNGLNVHCKALVLGSEIFSPNRTRIELKG